MKSGAFIELVANTLGVERKTVIVVARALREAGYLTTGPRGVNAPEMRPRDGASLCLALMTGEPPSQVVPEFVFYSSLQPYEEISDELELLATLDLKEGHTLLDLLEALFAVWQDAERLAAFQWNLGDIEMAPSISVVLNEDRRNVVVRLQEGSAVYQDIRALKRLSELDQRYREHLDANKLEDAERAQLERLEILRRSVVGGRGLRVRREITVVEIKEIGTALAGATAPAASAVKEG